MFLKVANDDVASFKNNNQWLAYHPNEALIFKDMKNVWSELLSQERFFSHLGITKTQNLEKKEI
jgi:hypothetical protein